jgi:5-methyltetrahydrofolate--homocysteine methyltransferase
MAEAAEGEFDLRSLDDAELVEQVHDDMYNGLKAEVEEATHIFLERKWAPDKVLNDATASCSSPRCCSPPTP